MADPLDIKEQVIQFIKNSEDFVSEDQIRKYLDLDSNFSTIGEGFVEFYETHNFTNAFKNNEVLRFQFYVDARRAFENFSDADPEWLVDQSNSSIAKNAYLISAAKYREMIEGMIELYLEQNNYQSGVQEIILELNRVMVDLLGLETATSIFFVDIITQDSLRDLLMISDKFSIHTKSRFNSFIDSTIILRSKYSDPDRDLRVIASLFNAFSSLKATYIPLTKLCLYLNMDKNFNDLPKPVRADELQSLIKSYPRFFIKKEVVHLISFNEILNTSWMQNFERIGNFPAIWQGEGLLVFKFVGENFPLKEAQEFVRFRPFIYFSLEKDFRHENLKDIESFFPELASFFGAFVSDNSIENWFDENIRIYFINGQLSEVQTHFDTLLKEFAPVCNLTGNPGNLFRALIEEKIREYESGKES